MSPKDDYTASSLYELAKMPRYPHRDGIVGVFDVIEVLAIHGSYEAILNRDALNIDAEVLSELKSRGFQTEPVGEIFVKVSWGEPN